MFYKKNLRKNTTYPLLSLKKNQYSVVIVGPYADKSLLIKLKKSNHLAHSAKIILKENITFPKIKLEEKKIIKTSSKNIVSKQKGKMALSNFDVSNNQQLLMKAKQPTKLWNLRQANIRSVIQAVSQTTGKNFLIDPRVHGKISIVSSKAINSDELYQVFLSMLQVSGFAAIQSGDIIKIIPNIDARSTGSTKQFFNKNSSGDEMIVQIVPIKYVSAEQLVPVLRPLMPQWSNVSAYGPSNMLILSGRASNIHKLSYLIEQVDNSSSNGIDAVSLKHALAMDIVATIKSLMDSQKGHNNKRVATIAADDQSNTILISGPKTERLRIRLLINKLDSKNAYNGDNTEVIYLKYLKAQDILPILSGVAKANFSGNVATTLGTITMKPLDTTTPNNGLGGDDQADSSNSQTETQPTQNNSAIASNTQASSEQSEGNSKPRVQIIAEPNTNSVILSAPQSLMRTLKKIIFKLDARPSQVLVEALITEIDERDINNLGLEWGMINGTAFQAGFALINTATRLSNFQAQLTALVTTRKANILSTPSVVVLDNRQAKILVGQQISIQDSSVPSANNGTVPYNTFKRQNVALHLYVRPQIGAGNSIQLQIDHGNDTLPNDTNATGGTPVINTSSIQTSVLVNSGDILVLGGLVQHGRQAEGKKIPILGDIPGIGELFQRNSHTKAKKILMVFIRPIILNSAKTGLQVTGSKYFNLRKKQLKWMQDYPYEKDNKDMIFKPMEKSAVLPLPFPIKKVS